MGENLIGFHYKGKFEFPNAWMEIEWVRYDKNSGILIGAKIYESHESYLAGDEPVQDNFETEERMIISEALMANLTAQFDAIMKAYIESKQPGA